MLSVLSPPSHGSSRAVVIASVYGCSCKPLVALTACMSERVGHAEEGAPLPRDTLPVEPLPLAHPKYNPPRRLLEDLPAVQALLQRLDPDAGPRAKLLADDTMVSSPLPPARRRLRAELVVRRRVMGERAGGAGPMQVPAAPAGECAGGAGGGQQQPRRRQRPGGAPHQNQNVSRSCARRACAWGCGAVTWEWGAQIRAGGCDCGGAAGGRGPARRGARGPRSRHPRCLTALLCRDFSQVRAPLLDLSQPASEPQLTQPAPKESMFSVWGPRSKRAWAEERSVLLEVTTSVEKENHRVRHTHETQIDRQTDEHRHTGAQAHSLSVFSPSLPPLSLSPCPPARAKGSGEGLSLGAAAQPARAVVSRRTRCSPTQYRASRSGRV